MKKLSSVLYIAVFCLLLTACGNTALTGDPVSYSNSGNSFSIDLPTANENAWVVNEETADDTLDISDAADSINIQIQCLAKNQAEYIASDLTAYENYSVVNMIGSLISDMEFTDAAVEVPDFITNSKMEGFTLKQGDDTVKGNLVFLESDSYYYTIMIMAIDETYDINEKALLESISSLKELEAPAQK